MLKGGLEGVGRGGVYVVEDVVGLGLRRREWGRVEGWGLGWNEMVED